MAGRIKQIVAADPGWRAVFGDGEPTVSRVVAWALVEGAGASDELVGLIVDPTNAGRVVRASDAHSPAGERFSRYGHRSQR